MVQSLVDHPFVVSGGRYKSFETGHQPSGRLVELDHVKVIVFGQSSQQPFDGYLQDFESRAVNAAAPVRMDAVR